jgi:hypothetical protein
MMVTSNDGINDSPRSWLLGIKWLLGIELRET